MGRERAHLRLDFEGPLSIDRETGAMRIRDSSLVFRSNMPLDEFLDSDIYLKTTREWMNEAYRTFRVHLQKQDESVYLMPTFHEGRVTEIRFAIGKKVAPGEWTRERVEKDLQFYEAFMIAQVGSTQGRFPWGRSWAAMDEKAGAPTMGIRYEK
jgi:hypothetical protein